MGAETSGRRRLRHRLPVSLRHYWRLIAGSVAALAAVAMAIGSVRATALVYSDAAEGFTVNWDIEGNEDLFDTSVAHEIGLDFDERDYEEMVATFEDTGAKEWIKADITIDGVTVSDVGIRLKGNSTLASLGGGISVGGMEDMEDMGDFEPPEGMEFPGATGDPEPSEGMEMPGGRDGGMGGFGGAALSFDEPESLPWLVDFSKFIDGQVYQGNRQISLRVESAMGGGSTLTEAVAAELVEASGQPSYDWTYSTVSVNGSEAVTRRVVDIMDVTWAQDRYGANAGVLYKARAGGQFAYQGEDPAEYTDDFKQLNMEGSADAQPIIDFLKWYDEADDATFASEFGEWFDVESFASYVALQNLIVNGDDMSGPGNNYYLWYDYGTGLFSVITWDLDLSLTGSDLGPEESESMGGFGGGGFGGEDGAAMPEDMGDMQLPEGADMPEGGRFPENMEMPEGGGEGGLGGMGGNDLKQRFLDSDAFDELYMEVYTELYEAVYASGAASEAVDRVAAAAELNGADVTEAAATLKATVEDRAVFLATELGTADSSG